MRLLAGQFVLMLNILSYNAFAAEPCPTLPEGIQATVSTNYDGSCAYNEPRLYVDGNYVPIEAEGKAQAIGFCVLVGKALGYWTTRETNPQVEPNAVNLDETGALYRLRLGENGSTFSILNFVTCK